MNNFHSSLAQLLQSNVEKESDTPTTLFDLINAHKSEEDLISQDIKSLSDLTSKHLNVRDKDQGISSLGNLSTLTNNSEEENKFSTLEEYTRSFLSNNSTCTFLSQKSKSSAQTKSQDCTTVLNEKLSNVKICDSKQQETRKIDLSAALLNNAQNNLSPSLVEYENACNESVLYPLKECMIDISSIASDILSSNDQLSQFGYVISRKWKHIQLPKKFSKIARKKPYNISKSFKFDTPSPDDIALKARNRTISSSNKD